MNTKNSVFVCAVVAATWIGLPNQAFAQPAIAVIYVDGDSGIPEPPNYGQNGWQANAYKYLQDALDGAAVLVVDPQIDNVELWVAATDPANPYRPDRDANHPTGTFEGNSFEMLNNVALLGGFAGTEQYNYQRDAATNVTVLDGLDWLDGVPEQAYSSEHVVKAEGLNSTAVIDGFTITNDHDPGDPDAPGGRGIYILNASPHVVRCTFKDCWAVKGGGAKVEQGATTTTPVFYDCIFLSNVANPGN